MGKLGFTPLIGLAVVVALALAAVFGAMSLTNPAFAAVGQPADAELAERTFAPQATPVTVYAGGTTAVDLVPLLEADVDDIEGVPALATTSGGAFDDDTNTKSSNTAIATAVSSLTLQTLAATVTGVSEGIAVIQVTVNVDGGTEVIELAVTVMPPTSAITVGTVPTVNIPSSGSKQVNLSHYFSDGKGHGKIARYSVTDPTDLTITPDAALVAATGVTDGKITITSDGTTGTKIVTATIGYGTDIPARYSTGADALDVPEQTFFVNVGAARDVGDAVDATLEPSSRTPGKNVRYDIIFGTSNAMMNTLTDELVIEFEDFDVPSSISASSIAITVDKEPLKADPAEPDQDAMDRTTIPEDVSVSGEKLFITIGDLNKDRTGSTGTVGEGADFDIPMGSEIHVVVRQSAGISNPTEAKTYGPVIEVEDADNPGTMIVKLSFEDVKGLELKVPREIGLDEEDGGLGTVVTATGKGFKDKTSLTVFLDKIVLVRWDHDTNPATDMVPLRPRDKESYNPDRGNVPMLPDDDIVDNDGYLWAPNGELDLSDDTLCVDEAVSGDDIGECEFTVTHPTFVGDKMNFVSAVDGRSGYPEDYYVEFDLTASVSASPDTGSPGEIILVQVVDFPPGPIGMVEISRTVHCDSGTCFSADSTGAGVYSLTIPNWVVGGVQELRVTSAVDDDVNASTNITFAGPQIQINPKTVLANQRVSVIGTGFSPGAVIANDSDPLGVTDPLISFGGEPISGDRINDSDPVRVDNGGNWSASVDLPLAEATTAEGERAIRVSDSRGRTGVVLVDVPAREVTVTPPNGRVGTIAVVRGVGFPSKNDEGSSFNVEIVYDASNGNTTTVSALPDASGRFETQLRIPTTAAIPSSNSIKVSFRDSDGVVVVTTVSHDVPEGIITLSETSGGPGSTITVSGEGFKSFVPISLAKVGTLDVTPAPKPSTDGNGMMNFDVIIPGLDVGIQTIEVSVGRTTASVGFTVTESGINPGDIKEVGAGLEDLGDNFVNIWHFNNDTKAWSFYDGLEGSDLTHLITGETYLIQIKSTIEVILNNDTRNLTCVGGNCWNQIVW